MRELATPQQAARKLRQPVHLAEIDLAALYRFPLRRATARELSRFQAVERDFSFTFADAVQWRVVAQAVEALQMYLAAAGSGFGHEDDAAVAKVYAALANVSLPEKKD